MTEDIPVAGGGAGLRRGRETPTIQLAPAAPSSADLSAPAATFPIIPVGETPYQILMEIGAGGMSVVSLARDLRFNRFVALKRLGPASRGDPDMQARFFREARLVAALNHIHIVRLYDVGEDREGPFLIMEYIAGPAKSLLPDRPPPSLNLAQKVEQNRGPLWPREAVGLVRKLCGAVDYAHRHGVIHRDLKPSNVLLDEFSEPRIADFGLAREALAEGESLTRTGTRMLSLGYGAPEQEEDAGLADARSDIYSLGGILYFCLTGENPRFFRDSRIIEYLRPALLKALDRDPARRWGSAAEFAEALAESVTDYLSPISDVGMWRCKWCSALNPLSTRYCHQCAWDGMEPCPECAGETRVGVRFCGACGTDIKMFEDMRALEQRLRDYRRQRDFARLTEAAESAARFQPRGPLAQELHARIAELADTAAWALRRKGEINQDISTAMAQARYELADDQLKAYDLLADDDAHESLRRELPWRMAERDLVAVCEAVSKAREALARRRLGECRVAVEAARAGRLHLARIAAQFPALKPLFTGTGADPGQRENQAFAPELARVSGEIDALTQSLALADARIAQLLAEAGEARRRQDHQGVVDRCRQIEQLSLDATGAAALQAEAEGVLAQITRLLAEAQQALADGNCRRARHLCGVILKHHQGDSAAARKLGAKALRTQRRRRVLTVAIALTVAAMLYVLSMAPAYRGVENGMAGTLNGPARVDAFYAPVRWLHAHTFLRRPLEAYLRWWDLAPIDAPGG